MTMIERVARAIARQAGYVTEPEEIENWFRYELYARAAIEAMRVPTEAMTEATSEIVTHVYGGDYNGYMDSDVAESTWNAMIDAALA